MRGVTLLNDVLQELKLSPPLEMPFAAIVRARSLISTRRQRLMTWLRRWRSFRDTGLRRKGRRRPSAGELGFDPIRQSLKGACFCPASCFVGALWEQV